MGGAKTAYLIAYNAGCMAGWAYALYLALTALADGGALSSTWATMGTAIILSQSAMALEMVHAATGMVRSPVMTTVMQVLSRLQFLVWIPLAPTSASQWGCGMMAISWALVEVPRYAFYLNNLVGPGGQTGTLYPIFWLRYSLFAILYPTGITGEVLTLLACLADPSFASALGGFAPLLIKAMLVLYVPASPFMYMNMVKNRKGAFKKRFAKPPPPPKAPVGAEFPEDSKGGRSTSEAGKKAFAAAIGGSGVGEAEAAAAKCAGERSWRFGYNKHITKLVRLSCESPAAGLGSAKAGLGWMYENMVYHSPDQTLRGPFGATVDKVTGSFETGAVRGGKRPPPPGYRVPYDAGWHPSRPRPPPTGPSDCLSGKALKAQAAEWAAGGIIEPDAAEALCWLSDHFDKGESLQDVYVVMIGAGSAMGPFPKLMEMGATVVAIDIPGAWGKGGPRPASAVWRRLCDTARGSAGSLVFPLSKPQSQCATDEELYEAAGCDLMKQPGEIANWLCEWQKTLPDSAKATRELHTTTRVAFLCTPTDIHVCTDASDRAARDNYGSGFGSFGLEKLANALSGGKLLIPNFNAPVEAQGGKLIKYVDGLAVAQGPNYALAKRMQHWRAMIEFESGAVVSSSVAPSTATISVLSNKTFAWAYGGMPYFKYEIFKQETTNAVMAALLMHDILNLKGPKNPANRKQFRLSNPIELFSTQAVHGGLWRSPYKADSLGEVSALIYFAGLARPYLLAAGAAAAAAAAFM
ncbi:hypothetical protein EMIHUDRAFT_453108 [Emiliania huxleyi CCMP1516]|uniref:very-long-chain (3R)-3-hydroxyacyl-CoA dehydratase n=2 Tax=Emiliania huxleyi TaxID=2903 RepID=A0A0D3IAV1_EMIH1|nr:hypothetical protein EMIHUDRAFT_453108 [Emiliania huxleyi CCMP1516]EOD08386.1 hypothetical protein EMIHUDRAFT_453108 [Emiliania huxleyi CCMP1516]|eukprot:XP_005760815.1 hypothetical protein EMIHUDRAFT_453108 [Emiliania huxleyi CCMP1516]